MAQKNNELLELEELKTAYNLIDKRLDGQEIVSIYLRGTFNEVVGELVATGNLLMTPKSFLVNMAYIKTYSSTSLTVQAANSTKEVLIPVSRQQASSVKQSYLQFMATGREN